MDQCSNYECPNRNKLSGYCELTACTMNTVSVVEDDNILIFPHTIGDITFYNKNELIEWVQRQQTWLKVENIMMNKVYGGIKNGNV